MAFETETVRDFLDILASDAPAPGGGSVAAIGGALGAALVSMVSNLTTGKEKYRDNWSGMEEVRSKSEPMRAKFVKLMNDDTESFNEFMAAMKMPKDTDEQKESRGAAMAYASKSATEVPLATLELCAEMAGLALLAARLGNRNAASDAGSAALLAEAAGKAAAYNVRINLPGIRDEAFAESARSRMRGALSSLEKKCRETERLMDHILKA
ncbi:MAG: cyclodeaminase/cyclohydrolase family protein [Synergistaceae bacterium]|jgi:glutamate formiminotransferase/formiminotetrahydrofolate cyclodeaminase|nr:cyclodeaminase/cyclohydrolase family protein [Synergistaceae bacterium]